MSCITILIFIAKIKTNYQTFFYGQISIITLKIFFFFLNTRLCQWQPCNDVIPSITKEFRVCVLTLERGWEKALLPDCCCFQEAHPCQAESPSFLHSCTSPSPAQSRTSTKPTTRPRWILSCCLEHRAGYTHMHTNTHTWAHLVKVKVILLAEEP